MSVHVRSSALVLLLALAGCTGEAGPGAIEEEIIGGTTDTGDPAVVLLYMTIPGQQGGSLCTGEIVSPHVVLTAAHCAGGANPSVTNAVWRVYLGPDFGKATAADMLPVKEAHYDPKFDINNLPAGNDVGVAILQNPVSIAPLPYSHTAVDVSFNGKSVRFVGYGFDNGTAQTGAGVKRTTTTTLTDHTDLLLHFVDATHQTCNGDSGGPALMNLGGTETIAGLTSYGDVNCSMGGWDTRVDAMAAWIDSYVQAADPGFGTSGGVVPPASTPPSPSGGSQSPPTSSATPMPPSSTGAGGVGASCVSDHDCQSRLCGLANNGTHMCFAADANVAGGCSLGGDARDDGAALGALVFLLAVLIGRRRSCATTL